MVLPTPHRKCFETQVWRQQRWEVNSILENRLTLRLFDLKNFSWEMIKGARESEKWESDGFSIYINSKVSIQGREWCEEIKWMVFSVFMFILNVSLLHLLFLSLLFTHLYFVFYVRSSVCACCVLVACCKVEILHSRLRRAHWCSFESLSSRCFQIISYLFSLQNNNNTAHTNIIEPQLDNI